ncbi:MAG: cysteine hydrolase family protein, partial [Stomatobaculum longum]
AMLPRAVARVKAAASDPSTRLIFTQDTHDADYLRSAEGRKLPVPHCIKPQKGWEICPALSPYAKNALIIEKNTFGAAALPEAVKGCEEILFLGLCTDICVVSNALLLKASLPEVKISVDPACCAGVTPEKHAAALETLRSCQVQCG